MIKTNFPVRGRKPFPNDASSNGFTVIKTNFPVRGRKLMAGQGIPYAHQSGIKTNFPVRGRKRTESL